MTELDTDSILTALDKAEGIELPPAEHGQPTAQPTEPEQTAAEDDAQDPGDDRADGQPDDDIDWPLLYRCAAEDQNDVGNAARLRHRFGRDLLHIQHVEYFAYDGRRWKEDVDLVRTRPMCHQTAFLIRQEPHVIKPDADEQMVIDQAQRAREEMTDIEAQMSALADGDIADAAAAMKALKARHADLKLHVMAGDVIKARYQAMRSARRKFSVSSGNSGKLAGMLEQVTPYISRSMDDMDCDPMAINVANGTLRFVKDGNRWQVACDPHRREDFMTKLMDVKWTPDAACPNFEKFLFRILPDEAVRGFVQRYFGYAMTGLDREQVFTIFHGEGRNGKSTLVDAVCSVMGEYSVTLPIASLVNENKSGKGSEATPDLARLPGARLVRSSEPKEGMAFDESLIKGLTSGEPIPVRRLHKEFIDVYPDFKMVISVNRKPIIRGNDDGIWRRVLMVPYDVQIPEDEIDRNLPELLLTEREGILNWLLEGCCNYLEAGLAPPEAVKAATREFREESDTVGGFVRAALEMTKRETDTITGGVMYNAFVIYCQKQGIPPLNGHTFGRRIKKSAVQFGFTSHKSSLQMYVGVALRDEYRPEHGRHRRDDDEHD